MTVVLPLAAYLGFMAVVALTSAGLGAGLASMQARARMEAERRIWAAHFADKLAELDRYRQTERKRRHGLAKGRVTQALKRKAKAG